jgi:hypothetical protein
MSVISSYCRYRPGVYLDPWIVFGGRWNGLGWIMISVGLYKFGDVSIIECFTFRSREIKERSSRPILSGEFPLNHSCRAGHFHSRQSERLDLYKHYAGKLIEVRRIESCRVTLLICAFSLAMPTDAFVLRVC